jgi:hypothetical protein
MEMDEDGEEHKVSPGSGDKRSKKASPWEEEDDNEEEEEEEMSHLSSSPVDKDSPKYLKVLNTLMKLANISGLCLPPSLLRLFFSSSPSSLRR